MWGGWNDVTAGGGLGRLQFGTSNSGLKTSNYGRFRSGKIFGAEGSSRWQRAVEAPELTLGVMDFLREAHDR